MKRIIFLDQEPLTQRRLKVFNLEKLIERGFHVEFWDLSAYCFGVHIAHTLEKDYVRKFHTRSEILHALDRRLQQDNRTLFIIEGYLAKIQPALNNYIRRNGGVTVCYEINTTAVSRPLSLTERIKLLSHRPWQIPLLIFGKCRRMLKKRINQSFSYVISSGNIFPADFSVNHSDYELFLELSNHPQTPMNPELPSQYIVYLDDFFPYHPDYRSHGLDIDHLAAPYFESLQMFFTRLETQLGMPVIVAAHPKAEYINELGKRRIEYGKSVRLVQDATYVVATSSASIGFAVMFHKPLLLITTDLRLKTQLPILQSQNTYQSYLAEMLGTSVTNISHLSSNELIHILPTEEQIRQKYLYRFHTSPGIENRMNMEFLPKIFDQLIENQTLAKKH